MKKDKQLYINKKVSRQILGMLLLLIFSIFQLIQFHHHHHPVQKKQATDQSSNLTQKCELCDFVVKKQNSHLEHQQISVPTAKSLPVSKQGFHYQTNWTASYALLTDNKGPHQLPSS